jgi:hypothetical protein
MEDEKRMRMLHFNMGERKLSIIVNSLFSSWRECEEKSVNNNKK